MRKTLTLIFAICLTFTAQAGYVIKGIANTPAPSDLMNYTLTFDGAGEPIAAGSMYWSNTPGSLKNAIVFVHPNTNMAEIFPFASTADFNLDIEVRDLHYHSQSDKYLLCGSIVYGTRPRAFVAEVNSALSSMQFYEYSNADIFYSLCIPSNVFLDYYVCGKRRDYGVIASIARNGFQITNCRITDNEWEYHKIIAKPADAFNQNFVVSGRDPVHSRVGLTTFAPPLNNMVSRMWAENTESASLCVVSDYVNVNNSVIVASSYQNELTLSSFNFNFLTGSKFIYPYTLDDNYFVQDISTIQSGIFGFEISVTGYMISDDQPSQHQPWYGYINGLFANSPIKNINSSFAIGSYENYKVRYHNGIPYTGGYFQNNSSYAVLFSSPHSGAFCDHIYESYNSYTAPIFPLPFTLSVVAPISHYTPSFSTNSTIFDLVAECFPFKGDGAPEFSMPSDNEDEIITFLDRVTLKDRKENINYQIFNITGQLIQSGTTNSDISTAQLSKGMYIIRLENGKVFKVVK